MPLRRVAGAHGIAAVGLLHPIKGRAKSFRELMAGSHQFNAVSRSSLLLGVDPLDQDRRVLVRGKGNHSAAPRSFEFRIGVRPSTSTSTASRCRWSTTSRRRSHRR